ncbi:MAG TPA: M14 family metallopeptidase [Gemmatimonadales bacterium]
MRAGLALAGLLLVLGADGAAQTTRAERTGYRETSSHADVLGFLDSLGALGAPISVDTLAITPGGRVVPYVVASRPLVGRPTEARRSGRPVVYLQANIHGGEVEGKEAALMLLRDLTLGPLRPLLDSLILLVVPIYNADGNEALAPAAENRPGQNGPARVGRRANGSGLDLNRDYVKMEAPETRGAARLVQAWDPDLFVDLHTTNGSYHGYTLTFAAGLNPNRTPADDYARDRFLPEVRRRVARRHGRATFWYGNFRSQHPDSLAQGWETYDPRPRFGTNWAGMRGRVAVLSEAYSNDDFRTRVASTYAFVREVLGLAAEEGSAIRDAVESSARQTTDSVTVRSRLGPPAAEEIIAEITGPAGDGAGGYARRRRSGVYRTLRMPAYLHFVAARREALPAAYLVPNSFAGVVTLLRRQGVTVRRLAAPWTGPVERFRIDSVSAGQLFEGHRPVRVEGRWSAESPATAPAGWFLVETAQPAGRFAGYLLEPASEDGVATWNLVEPLVPGGVYPILRSRSPVRAAADTCPDPREDRC